MDRSGDEPREVGWAEMDEEDNVLDTDITDPATIAKYKEKVLSSYAFADAPQEPSTILDIIEDLEIPNEIPDTFKG
jgi:hypothetical protein